MKNAKLEEVFTPVVEVAGNLRADEILKRAATDGSHPAVETYAMLRATIAILKQAPFTNEDMIHLFSELCVTTDVETAEAEAEVEVAEPSRDRLEGRVLEVTGATMLAGAKFTAEQQKVAEQIRESYPIAQRIVNAFGNNATERTAILIAAITALKASGASFDDAVHLFARYFSAIAVMRQAKALA